MIPRRLAGLLRDSLRTFPAVALVGSRQTGKTTLAKALAQEHRGSVYLDLERPSDIAKLAEPELYLPSLQGRLVILDEVQRAPGLFPVLRGLLDDAPRPGRFLLLGSASPDLLRQTAESLAGRVIHHELGGFLLDELPASAPSREALWLRGGYPPSLLAQDEAASVVWREAFVSTYLERDLPQLGIRVPAPTLRRFWQMLAHVHGQLWNASRLAASLAISAPSVARYLDILEETYLIRRLPPYHANLHKRLVRSPKIYFRDSGLLHTLLGIPDREALSVHPCLGASWEGWVVEQVLGVMPSGWQATFYRTAGGAEVDLLLHPLGGKPPIAVEIKRTATPRLSRGFREAFRDLGCECGFFLHAGPDDFPLAEGVTALPLTQIHRLFA
jgi:predicted AAA+ superfamily ATPase